MQASAKLTERKKDADLAAAEHDKALEQEDRWRKGIVSDEEGAEGEKGAE